MEFIELVTDKHNFVYKLSEQISLMKELFILCRCIKNNQLMGHYWEKHQEINTRNYLNPYLIHF